MAYWHESFRWQSKGEQNLSTQNEWWSTLATKYVLGIDTSNYKTSVAAMTLAGELLADERQLLPVKSGDRGLRQRDALFFHVQQLPRLMAHVRARLPQHARVVGIGVSVRPRPFAHSYMPVFCAGESFAESLAQVLGVPVIRTTHQEGHLAAARFGLGNRAFAASFLAVHLSGGTSDVLYARHTRFGFHIEMLAEDADLYAGQFIDRVGVALGLPFPAGPHLERLAGETITKFRLPSAVKGAQMSFSGPCTAAMRAMTQGVSPMEIASAVQACVGSSVAKAVAHAAALYPTVGVALVAGGVASNQAIKERVVHRLHQIRPNLTVQFAPAAYASDNAVGVAEIARSFLSDESGSIWSLDGLGGGATV